MTVFSYNQSFVFLDFDGVCTACDTTPGSYITNRRESYGASERCMAALKRFLRETGSKVIISSNWRRFEPDGTWRTARFGDVKNPLPKFIEELGDFYAGQIPPVRHVTKSQAVRMWFNENRLDPTICRYVIFDDDVREGFSDSEFDKHFILTDYAVGLTELDCEKAKKIIGS